MSIPAPARTEAAGGGLERGILCLRDPWVRETARFRLDSCSEADIIRAVAQMLPVRGGVCVQRRNVKTKTATVSKTRAAAKAPGSSTPDGCSPCTWCGPSGECLQPVIKSGRCGDWVWYIRGSKQCRRRWAKPKDPKTPAQLRCRARLAAASKDYSKALTDEQQRACIAAGAKLRTRPRLAQSGPLTGQLHWVRQHCAGKTEAPARPARTPKA